MTVFSKLQQLHKGVRGGAVIGVEGEEQWREDTSLGGAGADSLSVRGELSEPYLLAPVGQEAVDPPTEDRWHRELRQFCAEGLRDAVVLTQKSRLRQPGFYMEHNCGRQKQSLFNIRKTLEN